MMLISFIIIILLVYFLIIRPLTQRNNQPPYDDRRGPLDDRRGYYDDRRGYYDRPDYYPPPVNTGLGRFGSFAGGIAAGALLTYLFEQGRVGFDQFQAWRGLGDQDIMRELMDQNILQEHEIAQLQDEMDQRGEDQWDRDDRGNDHDYDYDDQNNQQDYDGFDQNNNNDDNWV